jgi:hypothetical protein
MTFVWICDWIAFAGALVAIQFSCLASAYSNHTMAMLADHAGDLAGARKYRRKARTWRRGGAFLLLFMPADRATLKRQDALVLAAHFLLALFSRLSPPPDPPWQHRPPEDPHTPAELCGAPGCDNPVGDHVSGEWCSAKCAAAWLSALPAAKRCDALFTRPEILPEPPPEPAWMARLTAWERAKADRLIADRKSPTSEERAA